MFNERLGLVVQYLGRRQLLELRIVERGSEVVETRAEPQHCVVDSDVAITVLPGYKRECSGSDVV